MFVRSLKTSALLLGAALGLAAGPAAAAWEPTKAVTFIIPAGTGGGADQMARFIQGVIQKNNLMSTPVVVLNKGGGAGAEGFLEMKASARDPHKIIITLSNLFTTPLGTGAPFNWKDMKPVTMLALDQFVLWTNAEKNYPDAKAYIDAVKAAPDRRFKMGGTGSKQEDQIITAAIEQKTGAKFTYIPYKGGGTVATQLVGGHIDSTVNNPIEQVAHWRAGSTRALCVFDSKPMPYDAKVTKEMSWGDIPTCKSKGLDVEYTMLRGIMTTPGVSQDVVDYYIGVLKKVRETPEWKDFMQKGAFNQSFMTGKKFSSWLSNAADEHHELMKKAGFLHKGS